VNKTVRAAAFWVAAAAFLVVLALVLRGYHADVYRKILITATLALSFDFLFGVTKQLAFSHVTFFGLGAYGVIILGVMQGWPMSLAIVTTVAVAVLLSLAVAIPTTRLEGFYLGLATFAFAQIFTIALKTGGDFTGGPDGLHSFATPALFGLTLVGRSYTFVIIAVLLATLGILRNLERSWFGRACRALGDNPEAASAMGINVTRTKIIVFTLTSTLGAIAGMVYAFVDDYVSPSVFDFDFMFAVFFMTIVGGSGRQSGVLLGVVVLTVLSELLGDFPGSHSVLIYGLVVVLSLLFWPSGLIGFVDLARARLARCAPALRWLKGAQ
jgi:branched-chain amino acid transport system permease protein